MGTKNRFSSRSGKLLEHLVLGAADEDRFERLREIFERLR